jgi:predicted  nucleic acid-binding Zn-ribbon protein
MNDLIHAYLDLQAIDQQILSLKKHLKVDTDQVANEKVEYKKLEKSLENTREILKKSKAEYDLKKLDLAVACEKRDKLAEKLQKITNNKEYKAIEKEGRTFKEEAEALTRFTSASEENLGKLQKSLDSGEAELVLKKALIKSLLMKTQDERDEFEKKIVEIQKKRDAQAKIISNLEAELPSDQKHLEQYNKLTKLPNGDILALMEDDTCRGCFMRVNTQLASKIKSLKKIAICTSCHRLLYVTD